MKVAKNRRICYNITYKKKGGQHRVVVLRRNRRNRRSIHINFATAFEYGMPCVTGSSSYNNIIHFTGYNIISGLYGPARNANRGVVLVTPHFFCRKLFTKRQNFLLFAIGKIWKKEYNNNQQLKC